MFKIFTYSLLGAMSLNCAAHALTYGPYPQETYTTCGSAGAAKAVVILSDGTATADAKTVCAYIAKQGAYGVVAAYRQPGTMGWPAQWQDGQTAIRFLRSKGFKSVGLVGLGLGGYSALGIDLYPGIQHYDPADPKHEAGLHPALSPQPDWVVAISPFNNLYDPALNQSLIADLVKTIPLPAEDAKGIATPIANLRTEAAPLTIVHGSNDKIVNIAQSRQFAAPLKQIGNDVIFHKTAFGHDFQGLTTPQINGILQLIGNRLKQAKPAAAQE
jgi:acetyl esterase/lipase